MNRLLKALSRAALLPVGRTRRRAARDRAPLSTPSARLPRRERGGARRAAGASSAAADLFDAQERYVALFDRGRATSLHLFEHVHGDSRDRGQAMVDLKDVYERAGLRSPPSELPDYLPAVLEFLAHPAVRRGEGDARRLRAHPARGRRGAARERGSPYAAVFDGAARC